VIADFWIECSPWRVKLWFVVSCNASLLSIIAITIVSDTSPPSTLAMTTPYGRCGQLQSLSFMSISAEMLHFPIDAARPGTA
jgi:hypothetical protein